MFRNGTGRAANIADMRRNYGLAFDAKRYRIRWVDWAIRLKSVLFKGSHSLVEGVNADYRPPANRGGPYDVRRTDGPWREDDGDGVHAFRPSG